MGMHYASIEALCGTLRMRPGHGLEAGTIGVSIGQVSEAKDLGARPI